MAASPVCDMKMRSLLLGFFLGLLAVVHTTPVDTVTQIPNKAEEAFIEGEFLMVDPAFLTSLTTESPKRNTTVHATQQPSSDFEGSAIGEDNYATTTQSVSHAQSSPPTVSSRDTDDFSSDSSTSQSLESVFSSSSVPNEVHSSVTPDHIWVSQTTDPAVSSYDSLSTLSPGSGSGSGDLLDQHTTTALNKDKDLETDGSGFGVIEETSTASSTSTTALNKEKDVEIDGLGFEVTEETSTPSSTSTTALNKEKDVETEAVGFEVTEETSTPSSTSTTALYVDKDVKIDGSGFEITEGMSQELSVSITSEKANQENKLVKYLLTAVINETSTPSSTSTTALYMEKAQGWSVEAEVKGAVDSDSSTTQSSQPLLETEETNPNSVVSSGPKSRRVGDAINSAPQNKEHATPAWIIIVGFIVGVIALVVLCVAIATREKWNGPNQVSQQEDRTDSSNQQRELEMETFLHKDKPKENGQAAEYTVIPLDELPENYSSH